MGKITVNHYLNERLKPKYEGERKLYPLYVQVIVNRTNYKFKSNFMFYDGYLSQIDLSKEFVQKILQDEKERIIKIVDSLQESGKLDLIKKPDYLKTCSDYLWDVLNRKYSIYFENECKKIGKEIPSILMNSDFYEINEVLVFTESEIDAKFSNEYQYCKMGMGAIMDRFFNKATENLSLAKLTVFDLLHGEGENKVMQAIKEYHPYIGGDSETEYEKVKNEIIKLALL